MNVIYFCGRQVVSAGPGEAAVAGGGAAAEALGAATPRGEGPSQED